MIAICKQVAAVARELTGTDAFTRFMNDVNRRIFELSQSGDPQERLGGIMAIGMMLQSVSSGGVFGYSFIHSFIRWIRSDGGL